MVASNARSEERVSAQQRARVRAGGPDIDAQVLDASSRGMLLSAANPPRHGEIVEVVLGNQIVVGQVRWCKGNQFGVKLGDRINVQAFIAGRGGAIVSRPAATAVATPAPEEDNAGVAYNFVYFSAAAIASIGFLAVFAQKLIN